MTKLLHELLQDTVLKYPHAEAVSDRQHALTYAELWDKVQHAARAFSAWGLKRGDRLGIYLEKRTEFVVAMFGAVAAGCVFVPINPVLKPRQVGYILRDCNIRILVTSDQRAADLRGESAQSPDLAMIVLVDDGGNARAEDVPKAVRWDQLTASPPLAKFARVIDIDMAGILYTSGSTGNPKGVVLSHRNLVAGARSVSAYLENTTEDRILSVLPLSFDAGLSQVTTAFAVGAKVILLNYLLARDVIRACADEGVTGITGVPPLWIQLAGQRWPEAASRSVRYFANTGGHMPKPVLDRLRSAMPRAKPYLMYGLTEAFRSTYLDPSEVDRRPDSIGKAIPNSEILVVRPDGTPCNPGEPGELVHRGALVSMGYWNDPQRTAERFRPLPGSSGALSLPEMAVWSGDIVRRDDDGFLYFVGRRDDMIKTSGYRVSPTEIEEVIYRTGMVGAAAAFGVPHPMLGQGIVAVATPPAGRTLDIAAIMAECRRNLPQYMVPSLIVEKPVLPSGPNGKIDRKKLAEEFRDLFAAMDP